MAKAPVSEETLEEQFGPHLNYMPPGGWKDESRRSRREAGEDPLLLLRTAVRHSAQGARQPGDRLRAVGGVSVQPGHALPKGVKRYMQDSHPDRLLDPLMRSDAGLPHGDLGRSARLHGAPAARDPGQVRQGRRRRLRRRLADQRESRTCWASSRAWRWARATSTTTAGSAWSRPAPPTSWRSASIAAPNPWSDIPKARSAVRHRREHRRVRADHDRLHLALPRQRRQADRCRSAHDADRAQCRPVSSRAPGHRPRAVHGHAARDPARRTGGPRVHRRSTPPASRQSRSRSGSGTRARRPR